MRTDRRAHKGADRRTDRQLDRITIMTKLIVAKLISVFHHASLLLLVTYIN